MSFAKSDKSYLPGFTCCRLFHWQHLSFPVHAPSLHRNDARISLYPLIWVAPPPVWLFVDGLLAITSRSWTLSTGQVSCDNVVAAVWFFAADETTRISSSASTALRALRFCPNQHYCFGRTVSQKLRMATFWHADHISLKSKRALTVLTKQISPSSDDQSAAGDEEASTPTGFFKGVRFLMCGKCLLFVHGHHFSGSRFEQPADGGEIRFIH